jgi:TonB-linked SusC/RagA family outer membrane protein
MKKKLTPAGNEKFFAYKQLFLVMKITVFLVILSVTTVLAHMGYTQETKLTVQLKNATIGEILNEIENNSEYYFMFNNQLIDLSRRMDFDVKNKNIDEILTLLFEKEGIQYKIFNRQIVLSPTSQVNNGFSLQQPRSIFGKVTDSSGAPLPGVTVVIKGTTSGTITGVNGSYTLSNVPADAILIFSFVGMKTQEIRVTGQASINITMEEDTLSIEEVVAVGYGTQSKKKLTTSVGSIKSENLQELPITTIADAFSGQISGVIAESGTGEPGTAPVLRMRGYGSINAGSEPLYVIDGMIVRASQFAALNPKSIESVDFLKDAAAGAIYGSRAGNGVIFVTTKKGQYGQATFSFNATFGLQEVTNKVDVLDRDTWLSFVKEAYTNDGKEIPDFYKQDPSNFANTNWQDEIFRTSPYHNYQLSVSGGSDKIRYYLAANILDNEGIIKTTYNKTYSSNGNFDIKVNPKLEVGLSYNAAYTKQRINNSIGGLGHQSGGYGISGGIIQQALWFAPIIPVYKENGDYGQYQGEFIPYFSAGYANPLANLKETHDIYSKNSVMGRMYLNYEPIQGISLNSSFSGSLYSYFRDWHVSPYLAGAGSPYANFSNPMYERIRAGQQNSMSTSWVTETYLAFKRTIATHHDLNFIIGYGLEFHGGRTTTATSSANDRGAANAANPIPAYDNYYRPNIYGAALVLGSGEFGENTFQSVFSRLNYSYKDRYLFMASIRRDGSSKFAPSERWGIFPAVSGAWRISQESFMKNISWLDDLKFRISYGVSGNDQFGDYAWQGKVNYKDLYTYADPAAGGSGTGIALVPSTIENKNLKWEVNKQINIGTDISIFNDRINLTADYFIRETDDMLLYRSLPLENGISSSLFDNIGNMTNKGFELALNTLNIKTKDLSWTTNLTVTKTKNEVGDVFTANGEIRYGVGFPGAGTIRIIEGHPMFEIYSWKSIGNFETQEQLNSYPGYNNPRIGDPMVEDYKVDGVINDDDMQLMGHILPDYVFGLTSTLRYKNFDLSVILNGEQGASKVVTALRQAALLRTQENTLRSFYDSRYIAGEPRSGLDLAFASTQYSGPRHSNVSYFIYDASYIRIKNVVLGYNIPGNIYSRAGIRDLRITLGVQNLHTFTKYPLYNPEANSNEGSSGTAQFGVDNGVYPLSRIYTVGLNLSF